MRIRGFWGEHDAPYLKARLICPSLKLNRILTFLLDTGASRTIILDRDAVLRLAIPYPKLRRHAQPTLGIGGLVETYELEKVRLLFVADNALHAIPLDSMPVLRHRPSSREEEERIKLLPSVIGRDILNAFEVKLNRRKRVVRLEG